VASIHDTIAAAVKAQIDTIASHPPCVVRQDAWKLNADPAAIIIVTKGEDATITQQFGGGCQRAYEVLVTVFFALNFQVQTDFDDAPEWLQKIRQKLLPDETSFGSVLPTVSSVYDVNVIDSDPESGGGPAIYSVARALFTYMNAELVK
jgi:hypothetical protein